MSKKFYKLKFGRGGPSGDSAPKADALTWLRYTQSSDSIFRKVLSLCPTIVSVGL